MNFSMRGDVMRGDAVVGGVSDKKPNHAPFKLNRNGIIFGIRNNSFLVILIFRDLSLEYSNILYCKDYSYKRMCTSL